jgi:hypothetical protein
MNIRFSICALFLALGATGAGMAIAGVGPFSATGPLPFGAPEAEWTAPNGAPRVELAPDRSPMLALDGTPLRDSAGRLVTVPLGDELRGTISGSQAELDRRRASVEQLADACRRGIPVPVTGEGSSSISLEDSLATAKASVDAAVAANGGRSYKKPC